jgi:hypothetical protein
MTFGSSDEYEQESVKPWNDKIFRLRFTCALLVIIIYCYAVSIVWENNPLGYLVSIIAGMLGTVAAMRISW